MSHPFNLTHNAMKKTVTALVGAAVCLLAIYVIVARAAEANSFQTYEFATLRWGGRDNTQLIRPSGKVEKLRPLLEKAPRPEGIDERSYYMNIAMNAVAREGFEFAGMTNDEIVMKRPLAR
jgi:hypothetical protein